MLAAREERLASLRLRCFFLRTMVTTQILGSSSSSSSSNRGASVAVGMWLGTPTLGVAASRGPCPVGLQTHIMVSVAQGTFFIPNREEEERKL